MKRSLHKDNSDYVTNEDSSVDSSSSSSSSSNSSSSSGTSDDSSDDGKSLSDSQRKSSSSSSSSSSSASKRGSRSVLRRRSLSVLHRRSSSLFRTRLVREKLHHLDDYNVLKDSDRAYATFKVLCVSALHPKASDEFIKDTLYYAYKRYGEIKVCVSKDLEERVAYVCFKNRDDARIARQNKPKVIIYDKVALVEPVYESTNPNHNCISKYNNKNYSSRVRSRSRSPILQHDYNRYYSKNVALSELYRMERFYDRTPSYVTTTVSSLPLISRDYRRDIHALSHVDYVPRLPLHATSFTPHHLPPLLPPLYAPPRPFLPFKPISPYFLDRFEQKDKFPNYLHHVPPEDDPIATRTLFVGNLELSITEDELKRIFVRYGHVEDVDIKRPVPGTGNAYAFVRYRNLDMAHRAKVELSGQYIGKFQCKIGYGKATPTTRIWVGGLSRHRTTLLEIEREFDRFGPIRRIDFDKKENCAYILYDTIEAATTAVKEMRGTFFGINNERKLRVDFADVSVNDPKLTDDDDDNSSTSCHHFAAVSGNNKEYVSNNSSYHTSVNYKPHHPKRHVCRKKRNKSLSLSISSKHDMDKEDDIDKENDVELSSGHLSEIASPNDHYVIIDNKNSNECLTNEKQEQHHSTDKNSDEVKIEKEETAKLTVCKKKKKQKKLKSSSVSEKINLNKPYSSIIAGISTLADFVHKARPLWDVVFLMKIHYGAKLYMVEGDEHLADSLTIRGDVVKFQVLKLTHYLRLVQTKLDSITQRMKTAKWHGVFLALPRCEGRQLLYPGAFIPLTPFKELIARLKQKKSAGVMRIINTAVKYVGVLYAFPPCKYSTMILKTHLPKLKRKTLKENYLVCVVLRGETPEQCAAPKFNAFPGLTIDFGKYD